MNIFVAGVHGVGKTYLASQIPIGLHLTHTSASKLIKEERGSATWGADKRVEDVDENQRILARSVKRRNESGERLLLDGHFVLIKSSGEFTPLQADVFRSLDLDGVVLLEADVNTIAARLVERGGERPSADHLKRFIAAEQLQARAVCRELEVSITVLESPTLDCFVTTVEKMLAQSR